ncbi:hypothetical protein [Aliarcobacter vitoriensis]|uniref:Uncharacterized protein n=1 Tax=Aliarcobacter vitoriensis TaxID=2011099 RepID=A0A366MUV0_9BACT|nr:hypothetical protein [Aliarcobacter vitoriensis]RBQ29837.1 hypothetical protein CRU91_02615 [Aliarcobacter vitoriensis]
MFKFNFKWLQKSILIIGFLSLFGAINAFAEIKGNNSFATAYSFGYWEYHSSGVTSLAANENDAFYSFRVNAGDRVYVRLGIGSEYIGSGINLQIFNSNKQKITEPNSTIISSSLPFIFDNVDGSLQGQTFYIKVNRGNYVGNMVFVMGIEKRIYSSNGTYDFIGISSNPGNPNILTNPNGIDSSIITMDLTNKSTIPVGAIVKSITTSGSVYPSKGGILHKISSNQDNIWHTATVEGSGYNINVSNALKVKQIWSFRYNQKAMGASTMKNVKANINYEYDVTEGF